MTKVYSSKFCAACANLKSMLKEKGIDFEEVDITENSNARDEIINAGFRRVPILFVNGRFLAFEEIDNYLKNIVINAI